MGRPSGIEKQRSKKQRTCNKASSTHKEFNIIEIYDQTKFCSMDAFNKYSVDFSRRAVIPGKPISPGLLSLFEEHKFVEGFGSQGWTNFLTMHNDYYPCMIRMFYANLSGNDDRIESLVNGKKIILTPKIISQFIGAPCKGDTAKLGKCWTKDKFSPVKQLEVAFGEHVNLDGEACEEALGESRESEGTSREEMTKKPKNATKMPPRSRVVHRIITCNISPRGGHFDNLSFADLCIMAHVLTNTPYNLPKHMIKMMRRALESSINLPYGMFLSMVFEKYGVPKENEYKESLKTDPYINSNTLTQMGLKLVDGIYCNQRFQQPKASQNRNKNPSNGPPQPAVEVHNTDGLHDASLDMAMNQVDDNPSQPTEEAHNVNELHAAITSLKHECTQNYEELLKSMAEQRRDFEAFRTETLERLNDISSKQAEILHLLKTSH